MRSFSRLSSISSRSSTPLDAQGLPSPFQSLSLELSQDELRETSYEIFAASCRAASGISNIMKSKSSLNYVPQASQKTVSANAASTIKKALGLRPKKSSEKEQLAVSPNTKKPQTVVDVVKMQMDVSDQTDTRIRRALSRTAAGQAGKNVDTMLLPLELLQQIRLADFGDVKEYQQWQKRQLKVLELGLLLRPAVKLEEPSSAAQRLRHMLHSSIGKPLETGKNSESMQALRSATTSLASRSDGDKMQDICHWADGFPFNVHLYQMFLSSCFDKADETNLIDEVDDVIDLFKKTWSILGLHQALHNICFMWVLFRQFVATGQQDLDLLRATNTQMAEVAVDAKGNKDPQYVLVLSSVLTSMHTWIGNRLFAYHDTFPDGATGLMDNLLPVALSAAKILHEDISHEFRRKRKEDFDIAGNKIDFYVRSSLKTAFAQVMERRSSFNKKGPVPSLVSLANNTSELKEKDRFSPALSRWHACAASLAAATLHSCFSREFKQYLSGVTALTNESVEILQAADHLAKDLLLSFLVWLMFMVTSARCAAVLLLLCCSITYSSASLSALSLCNRELYAPPWKLRSDQVTILMSGFAERRLPLVRQIARSYSVSPIVHSIYILWGNTSTPWALLNHTDIVSLGAPVYVVRQETTSLNDRFLPRTYIQTRAVLICDDDITIDLDELKFAFQMWKENERRIVGFFPRSHEYQLQLKSWIYTIHPDRYSIMLTKLMILATKYLYQYTCTMPRGVKEYIDSNMNCEDIAMNFVVANSTNQGPLLVNGKPRDWGDTRNSMNDLISSALSAKKQHRKNRGDCITVFHHLWEGMPLRYSFGKAINRVEEQVFCEKHGSLVPCNDQSEV